MFPHDRRLGLPVSALQCFPVKFCIYFQSFISYQVVVKQISYTEFEQGANYADVTEEASASSRRLQIFMTT
jgi:hypothetical protein